MNNKLLLRENSVKNDAISSKGITDAFRFLSDCASILNSFAISGTAAHVGNGSTFYAIVSNRNVGSGKDFSNPSSDPAHSGASHDMRAAYNQSNA